MRLVRPSFGACIHSTLWWTLSPISNESYIVCSIQHSPLPMLMLMLGQRYGSCRGSTMNGRGRLSFAQHKLNSCPFSGKILHVEQQLEVAVSSKEWTVGGGVGCGLWCSHAKHGALLEVPRQGLDGCDGPGVLLACWAQLSCLMWLTQGQGAHHARQDPDPAPATSPPP